MEYIPLTFFKNDTIWFSFCLGAEFSCSCAVWLLVCPSDRTDRWWKVGGDAPTESQGSTKKSFVEGQDYFPGAQHFAKQQIQLWTAGLSKAGSSSSSVLEQHLSNILYVNSESIQRFYVIACIQKKSDNVFCHGTLPLRVKGPPAVLVYRTPLFCAASQP